MRNTGAEYRNPNRITCTETICRGLWIFAVGLLACAIAMVGVILGSTGIVRRMHDQANEQLSNLWETTCVVMQRTTVPYLCNRCDVPDCNITICEDEKFQVSYPIYDGTTFVSWISVNDTFSPHDIEIDHEYTCYYDRSLNYRAVQWDYIRPKSQAALIGAGIGLVIAAFAVLIFLSVYVIFVERPRMKRFNRRNQMLRHLSGGH